MLTLDKIYHAAYVLKSVARKTDLIAAPGLNAESEISLKTENLQVTGSFKVRGAYDKISQLTADEKAKGVIASSAGNHAQGVALAAQRSNIPSVICMPDGAPISKVEATKQLGAEVRLVKGAYDDAYATALQLQEDTGATFIHPFDDDEVIAGQGTIGLEMIQQDAVTDLNLRIQKVIRKLPMEGKDQEKLLKSIDTAAGKVVGKMMFGLRDFLEKDSFLECMDGLEKLYETGE